MDIMGYEYVRTETKVSDGVAELRACCRLREVDWWHQCSSNEPTEAQVFVNEQNMLTPVDVERTRVEIFDGRQQRARGSVSTGGTETGTVHDS